MFLIIQIYCHYHHSMNKSEVVCTHKTNASNKTALSILPVAAAPRLNYCMLSVFCQPKNEGHVYRSSKVILANI
jgi:hypothetical protein